MGTQSGGVQALRTGSCGARNLSCGVRNLMAGSCGVQNLIAPHPFNNKIIYLCDSFVFSLFIFITKIKVDGIFRGTTAYYISML